MKPIVKTPADFREARKMDLDALASKAPVARNTVEKVESGRPDVSTRILRLLARALDAPVREYVDSYIALSERATIRTEKRRK